MPAPLLLHGAASVIEALVGPHRAAVEVATGQVLQVEKSNAGKGMRDLLEGRCHAALVSASLEASLAAARSAGLERPAPADLQLHQLGSSEVVFVVHPQNPVRELTWAQLAALHTGKVASWKELGGPDLPVAVHTDAAASATRALVQQVVLQGAPYAPGARAVDKVSQLNEVVGRDPAGIGALGLELVDRAAVAIVRTPKVERPLSLVTVGEPSAALRQVIEAYRAAAAAPR